MRKRIVVGALAAAFAVAACGGGSEDPIAGGAGADAAEPVAEVTLPEPAPGPVPELPVAAASVSASPLPEIAVRQINGEGGWVQFKNELPADKPLLVWFWAPH